MASMGRYDDSDVSTWRRGVASGLALIATLALMGLVLAVGYLGSERDRALNVQNHVPR